MTGSVSSGAAPFSRAPTSSVTSEPLPPPGGYSGGAPAYAPAAPSYPAYQQSPSYSQSNYGSSSSAHSSSDHSGPAGGRRTIVVEYGDTPYSLGQRYGVPASKILSANQLPQGATLSPGQRIVIPAGTNQAAAERTMSPPPTRPSMAAAPALSTSSRSTRTSSAGGSHTVASGETLFSLARQYNVPVGQLASANGYGLDHQLRIGESVTIPGGADTRTAPRAIAANSAPTLGAPEKPLATPIAQPVRAAEVQPVTEPAPAQMAAVEPKPKLQPVVASAEPKPAAKDEDAAERGTSLASVNGADFRWPVRGRVISGFGSKPNGSTNDGINLSVPEGTPIKASEGGVVAYAGNELKGFGNLVLIRHQGEWVTAYAHASEIMVKRGDVVRRGQIIAKSGKSGNVSAPQLHFEVRRGATPVDPMKHLPAG
ncbi:peptidoglycan DD-metalloendopeptidase family protein [Terrihabitans sp. B22-R8]|uniref:peptidoglycan DD-metalloendopeptidase family protein n=1 Tax=Terrihabitans sp. B22-R8 TaxID=3425128 RepID=UPI00403C2C7B